MSRQDYIIIAGKKVFLMEECKKHDSNAVAEQYKQQIERLTRKKK